MSTIRPQFAFFMVSVLVLTTANSGCGGSASGPGADYDTFAQQIEILGGEIHIHLEFGGSTITDSQLAGLRLPESVRSISLRDSAITDVGVADLKRAVNLERLDLTNSQITDAAIEDLKQLPKLWQIDVASPKVSPQAFGQIRLHVDSMSGTIKRRSTIKPLPRLPVETKTRDPLLPPE